MLDRPARRRHGRGARAVHALQRFRGVAGERKALAVSFGFPYVVRVRREGAPIGGTTADAAAETGIPAVITEAGGCGLLEKNVMPTPPGPALAVTHSPTSACCRANSPKSSKERNTSSIDSSGFGRKRRSEGGSPVVGCRGRGRGGGARLGAVEEPLRRRDTGGRRARGRCRPVSHVESRGGCRRIAARPWAPDSDRLTGSQLCSRVGSLRQKGYPPRVVPKHNCGLRRYLAPGGESGRQRSG